MTPAQADAYQSARRTDAPTRYTLNDTELHKRAANCAAKTVAVNYISRADRVEVTALLRSLEDPVMPVRVERSIQDEITAGLARIKEIS